ncbi:MAG: hypothetical protein RSD23_04770 [Ruthenibacterium sp.]
MNSRSESHFVLFGQIGERRVRSKTSVKQPDSVGKHQTRPSYFGKGMPPLSAAIWSGFPVEYSSQPTSASAVNRQNTQCLHQRIRKTFAGLPPIRHHKWRIAVVESGAEQIYRQMLPVQLDGGLAPVDLHGITRLKCHHAVTGMIWLILILF